MSGEVKAKPVTPEEASFIKDNYATMTVLEIAEHLDRKPCTVQKYAWRHKFKSGKKRNKPRELQEVKAYSYNVLYRLCKKQARDRNYAFELTKEDHIEIVSQNCKYCGDAPRSVNPLNYHSKSTAEFSRKNGTIEVSGIDRLDNSKGYIKENCVPCCPTCNKIKLNYDLSFIVEHLKKIIKNMEK